jgi:hypothetical protein
MHRIGAVIPSLTAHTLRAGGVSGKLSVPVSARALVYAHFRHVVGVSSDDPGQSVPLLKLRILDNLIETYLKTQPSGGVREEDMLVPVSERTVDTTIAALSADLHEALAARPGGQRGVSGAILSLDA